MEVPTTTESVRTFAALNELLDKIESGAHAKPDWIKLKGNADLSRLEEAERVALVHRLHGAVLRGFEANKAKPQGKRKKLAYWTSIAANGFHDFAEDCWMKCYDATQRENYDYISPYLDGGIHALDPYAVYSSVLGTWEYTVEDFLHTEMCKGVRSLVEPLAGTAEFSYVGHFRYPDLRYGMFDLDPLARDLVDARPWVPQTQRKFVVGNALDEAVWKQMGEFCVGPSLAYIGKQSQNFFDVKELTQILQWGTTYLDYLMLEISEPYLLEDEPTIDDVTRPEMKAAGFKVALEDLDDDPGNPLTNRMSFDLVAWDREDRRVLFSYHDWIGWQAPTLTALGQLLNLEVYYFHSEDTEFLPVDEGTDTCDCLENNTFILFRQPTD